MSNVNQYYPMLINITHSLQVTTEKIGGIINKKRSLSEN